MPDRDSKPKIVASCTIENSSNTGSITFTLKEIPHEQDDCDASDDYRYVIEQNRTIAEGGKNDTRVLLKTSQSKIAYDWFIARTT